MANSYVEIRNAKQNLIIDDNYNIPKFLYRGVCTGNSVARPIFGLWDGDTFKYRGGDLESNIIIKFATLRDLGFELDTDDKNIKFVENSLMLFTRSRGGKPYKFYVSIRKNPYADKDKYPYYIYCFIASDIAGLIVEYCIYTALPMIPCSLGAQAFNAKGELVFDAMRGYLQVIGNMYGNVNVRNNPCATYRIEVPSGLSESNVFYSSKSTLPFYSAYNIGANGVGYGETFFYPIMRSDGATLVIELFAQYNVSGKNSAKSYNNYYENVIYCPYPSGVWITGK